MFLASHVPGSFLLSALAAMAPQEQGPVDFRDEVLPLLADRCFPCHGPDAAARKAELRLDRRDDALRAREGAAAIVAGHPDASALLRRVTAADPDERMPPAERGPPLTAAEVAVLRRWVAQGAEYERHWSFEPPRRAALPQVRDAAWPLDPMDHFVLAGLERAGLSPAPAAPPAVWLRRATFAVTGLPPTADEVRAFVAADADDGVAARERAVDRLLASPHFGERMAVPWLDLARYADTYGYQSDVERRVWPYRDWVIAAYNDNLPYDRFVRWQLAGDLQPAATPEQRLATAFNRLHRQTNEGGSVEEEFRVEYVNDRVNTMGTAFLGLTLECARCHDHKFDPITQREYYRLTDYFDDIDECGLYSHFTNATPTPAMDLPSDEQAAALQAAAAGVQAAEAALAALLAAAPEALPAPSEQGRFSFDEAVEGGYPDSIDGARLARAEGDHRHVDGWRGRGIALTGDEGLRFAGVGQWRRWEPFSVAFWLRIERRLDRAVLLHRSKSWTDAGSQGWQLLVEDGRLLGALVHFWPGDAIAVRTRDELPLDRWTHLGLTYDGSSSVDGLRLFVDGVAAPIEVVADDLTRGITGGGPGDTSFGARFRDRGFVHGVLDEVRFFGGALAAAQMAAVALGAAELPPAGESAEVTAARERLRQLRQERDQLRDQIPQLMVMQESRQARRAHLLTRGSYELRAEAVGRGVPAALLPGSGGPDDPADRGAADARQPADRDGLADWLLAAGQPLTARVEVDRLWRAVFGRGLVDTPEDFGAQGAPPAQQPLLDWLAVELREGGWDRKAMLRRLLLSATFAQSSRVDAERRARDPDNRLWSRWPARRLSAEMLRDAALRASGLLVPTVGGPSVKPYQPPGLWKETSGSVYRQDTGDGLHRRSLYTFWKRTSPPPAMMILDAVKRDVCVARRQETSTPLQALVLWNDPQFGEAARVLAARLLLDCRDDDQRVEELFMRSAGRSPRPAEARALLALLREQRDALDQDPERAALVVGVGEAPAAEGVEPVEQAAWTIVCSTLLAADPVVNLR